MKAMNSASSKEPPIIVAYPKTLLSIAASVGGLAVFLIFASLLLVSHPIGSTVRGYFYGIDRSGTFDSVPLDNKNVFTSQPYSNVVKDGRTSGSSFSGGNETLVDSQVGENGRADLRNGESVIHAKHGGDGDAIVKNGTSEFRDTNEVSYTQQGVAISSSAPQNVSKLSGTFASSQEGKNVKNSLLPNITEVVENPKPPFQSLPDNPSRQTDSINLGCDLYHGKWVYDLAGPLYTNNSCPVLTQMQNCQGNGRPDKEYENWRWKPAHCDLPRFDGKKFLELMRGKTLAFIGDSVARNQMESMLCILWQVEIPKNRGNRRMQRYQFKSTSTMIVRIWSSWLVRKTSEPFDFAPEGVAKLHLDAPDPDLMEIIPNFDVVVISSGHWFAKQSAYVLNNEIVGGQLWWPDKSRAMKINSVEAFGKSVETILTAMATNPNYTGLTILRSYSPDHYEGGAWNTGGSCTGKMKPVLEGELVENGFTNIMHEKQVAGFNRAIKKKNNKSKLRLMDITKVFGYRQDGHPGPYRSPDPNKITKRSPDGRPPPQDCLHWCMPGPVDTWNELVYEIIRREFEGS